LVYTIDCPIYCLTCGFFLNQIVQFTDHCGGKKHSKHRRRFLKACLAIQRRWRSISNLPMKLFLSVQLPVLDHQPVLSLCDLSGESQGQFTLPDCAADLLQRVSELGFHDVTVLDLHGVAGLELCPYPNKASYVPRGLSLYSSPGVPSFAQLRVGMRHYAAEIIQSWWRRSHPSS
jgi:hypothetical protein